MTIKVVTMKFSLVCNLALGMSERLKRFRLLIKSKENNLVANKYKKIKKKTKQGTFNESITSTIKRELSKE